MKTEESFQGFPKETISFFQTLGQNNNTTWFNEHKQNYIDYIVGPSRAFISRLGERLQTLSPAIIADQRTNGAGSLFRIYRDVRFSKDKSPYKTHMGIFFWHGPGKKMESPGFYFHLDPGKNSMGFFTGMHMFPKNQLEQYRRAVVDDKKGPALIQAVDSVLKSGPYEIAGQHYKRFPRGYDPEHPNAAYLLHNGLHASLWMPIPKLIYSESIIDECFSHFSNMTPLLQWLVNSLSPAV